MGRVNRHNEQIRVTNQAEVCTIVKQLSTTIGVKKACRQLAVPRSWYYRRQKESKSEAKKENGGPQRRVKHQLTQAEGEQVRDILNSERFMDKSPRQVYATLLDEGKYHCHWRTMYRVLAAYGEVRERRKQSQHPPRPKPELVARGINEIWSWDITWLPTLVKGRYFYLYVIIDMYSRYVVGWHLATVESAELAEQFIAQACARQGIEKEQLTLHADRGAPMRSKTVTALLQDLGVKKSHSRPRTSNDNAYSEAQFKTLKYRPDYPGEFVDMEDARQWVRAFMRWYNQEHYHSGLSLLTPKVVHEGHSKQVCAQRQKVLDTAYQAHPERFKNGRPESKREPAEVWLNPPAASGTDSQGESKADLLAPIADAVVGLQELILVDSNIA